MKRCFPQFLVYLFAIALSVLTGACAKDQCFDQEMKDRHSGVCPQDCPGVCGCDGVTYCNECIANSEGIKVVSEKPCR